MQIKVLEFHFTCLITEMTLSYHEQWITFYFCDLMER